MTQPLSPEEIGKLFQAIDNQPTGRLSELAKLAGLNLAEDYIGADLSGEDLSGDNLSDANLSNADLSNANLSNTDLSYVNLTDANLSNTNLSHANLNNADLSNVNLSNANLFSTTLSQANLNNANLSYANCENTNFFYVKNITTAKVDHTLMTATLGLSKKEIFALKQRGAIIHVNNINNNLSRLSLNVSEDELQQEAIKREQELERLFDQRRQAELKKQKQRKSSPPISNSEDDLSSDRGVDYTQLRNFLKAGNWKEADHETYLVMLLVVGRKKDDWIRDKELLNFPCDELCRIDRLWVKYSNEHFGFSIQKKIYLEVGGIPDGKFSEEAWGKFGERVGWRVEGSWISYDLVTFDTIAPVGHLPFMRATDSLTEMSFVSYSLRFSALASRLVYCNI